MSTEPQTEKTKKPKAPKKSRSEKIQRLYEARDAAILTVTESMDLDDMRGALDECAETARDVAGEYEEAAPNGNGPNQEKADTVSAWADNLDNVDTEAPDDIDDDIKVQEAIRLLLLDVLKMAPTVQVDLHKSLEALDVETGSPIELIGTTWEDLQDLAKDKLTERAAESKVESTRDEALEALNGLEL